MVALSALVISFEHRLESLIVLCWAFLLTPRHDDKAEWVCRLHVGQVASIRVIVSSHAEGEEVVNVFFLVYTTISMLQVQLVQRCVAVVGQRHRGNVL